MLNSHIHLDFDNVKTPSAATTGVIIPSTGKDNWDSVIACCHSNKNSYFALGIHPWLVKDHQMIDLYDLEVKIEEENKRSFNKTRTVLYFLFNEFNLFPIKFILFYL